MSFGQITEMCYGGVSSIGNYDMKRDSFDKLLTRAAACQDTLH